MIEHDAYLMWNRDTKEVVPVHDMYSHDTNGSDFQMLDTDYLMRYTGVSLPNGWGLNLPIYEHMVITIDSTLPNGSDYFLTGYIELEQGSGRYAFMFKEEVDNGFIYNYEWSTLYLEDLQDCECTILGTKFESSLMSLVDFQEYQ